MINLSPELAAVQLCLHLPISILTQFLPYIVDPQAGAVSHIRRRIFVRRKSAEKVRLAKYAKCRQVVFA